MTEIQNSKPQMFWSLEIVICYLFVIWCLYFGILTVLVLGIFKIGGFSFINMSTHLLNL